MPKSPSCTSPVAGKSLIRLASLLGRERWNNSTIPTGQPLIYSLCGTFCNLVGKNHLSASAMQGGKAEPRKEKGKSVDEFVVQLISDPEIKWVLPSQVESAFGMCNKSEFVLQCSQEKSFKCGTKGTQFQVFSCVFSSTVSCRGTWSKVYKFTWERGKCKTDPLDIPENSNSAEACVGQWQCVNLFLARKAFFKKFLH